MARWSGGVVAISLIASVPACRSAPAPVPASANAQPTSSSSTPPPNVWDPCRDPPGEPFDCGGVVKERLPAQSTRDLCDNPERYLCPKPRKPDGRPVPFSSDS